MSDSESDCLSPRSFYLDGSSMLAKASVKGPNFQKTLNLNFSNMLNIPHNFEKLSNQKYEERFSKRSENRHYDWHASPMSLRSVPRFQPQQFHQSFDPRGMAHSSMMSSRAVSPTMSMRSMNSNVSVAESIISALRSTQFNNHELRNIKDTCSQILREQILKKQSKSQKLKLFLKGAWRKSGDDSRDQASDSSTASDDYHTTKSSATMYRGFNRYGESYRYPQNRRISNDSRSVRSCRTDFTDLHRTIRDSELCRDQTENLQQNSFKNVYSLGSSSSMSRNINMSMNRNMSRSTLMGPPPKPMPFQRDRFRNNLALPSQRFYSSTVPSIPEEYPARGLKAATRNMREISPIPESEGFKGFQPQSKDQNDSEQEEIFNKVAVLERTIKITENENLKKRVCGKRNLNMDNIISSDSKKSKLTPKTAEARTQKRTPKVLKNPESKTTKITKTQHKEESKTKSEDFVFAKPQFSAKLAQSKIQKKLANPEPAQVKPKVAQKEPLATKSKEPTAEELIEAKRLTNEKENIFDEDADTTSDISQRPSFMKRKLFTKTLDVTEIKNDTSLSSSPHASKYESKEKNKSRKLVTNNHYLSRDIQNDDSNFLDLIHKIVPADQINQTQTMNNRSSDPVMSKVGKVQACLTSKSAVNLRNKDDSFTDEDIFVVNDKGTKEKLVSKCTVVLDKLDEVPVTDSIDSTEEPKITKKVQEEVPSTSTGSNSKIVTGRTLKKTEPAKNDIFSYAQKFFNGSESDEAETPQKKPAVEKTLNTNGTTLNGTRIKKALPKTLKSDLDKVSDSSQIALKKNKDQLNESKSRRIRALKESKTKKAQNTKPQIPVDLEETLYDVIKKGRGSKNRGSSLETSKEHSKNETILKATKSKVTKQAVKKVVEKPEEEPAPKAIKKAPKATNEKVKTAAKTNSAKQTLTSLNLSPTKATRSDNRKSVSSPKLVVKKTLVKKIANKSGTKDLNQSMITRRMAMKSRLEQNTSSKQEIIPKKTSKSKSVASKNTKTQLSNKNNISAKPQTFKTTLNETTVSDASLNVTRKRGRPRKRPAEDDYYF